MKQNLDARASISNCDRGRQSASHGVLVPFKECSVLATFQLGESPNGRQSTTGLSRRPAMNLSVSSHYASFGHGSSSSARRRSCTRRALSTCLTGSKADCERTWSASSDSSMKTGITMGTTDLRPRGVAEVEPDRGDSSARVQRSRGLPVFGRWCDRQRPQSAWTSHQSVD